MTSPTTSELRAWARAQGMDVRDRGRLSPDVRAAWDAVHGAGPDALRTDGAAPPDADDVAPAGASRGARERRPPRTARPATSGSSERTSGAPARSPRTSRRAVPPAGPARQPAAATAPPAPDRPGPAAPVSAQRVQPARARTEPARVEPVPVPTATPSDPRIDDLERQVGELARRLAQLERAASAAPPRRRFGRRG